MEPAGEEVPTTAAGTRSMKQERIQAFVSREPLPESFRRNSIKESLVLEYVDNFRNQYVQLYPDRPPLLLAPLNEAGVPKFVCTTLRPTLLPIKQLYDMAPCARFLASYIQYEPLEDPTAVPTYLPSPHFTLTSRAGDCFDMSMVLASYLLGAGYDAFVVCGTAPRWITQRMEDRSKLEWTEPPDAVDREAHTSDVALGLVPPPADGGGPGASGGAGAAGGSEPGRPPPLSGSIMGGGSVLIGGSGPLGPSGSVLVGSSGGGGSSSRYKLPPPPSTTSEFAKAAAEKAAQAAANAAAALRDASDDEGSDDELARLRGEAKATTTSGTGSKGVGGAATPYHVAEEDEEAAAAEAESDPLYGSRVHAWVLVRAGKRDVSSHVFIEPSTGACYPVDASPYHSVEACWNHRNYHVSMQGQALLPRQPGRGAGAASIAPPLAAPPSSASSTSTSAAAGRGTGKLIAPGAPSVLTTVGTVAPYAAGADLVTVSNTGKLHAGAPRLGAAALASLRRRQEQGADSPAAAAAGAPAAKGSDSRRGSGSGGTGSSTDTGAAHTVSSSALLASVATGGRGSVARDSHAAAAAAASGLVSSRVASASLLARARTRSRSRGAVGAGGALGAAGGDAPSAAASGAGAASTAAPTGKSPVGGAAPGAAAVGAAGKSAAGSYTGVGSSSRGAIAGGAVPSRPALARPGAGGMWPAELAATKQGLKSAVAALAGDGSGGGGGVSGTGDVPWAFDFVNEEEWEGVMLPVPGETTKRERRRARAAAAAAAAGGGYPHGHHHDHDDDDSDDEMAPGASSGGGPGEMGGFSSPLAGGPSTADDTGIPGSPLASSVVMEGPSSASSASSTAASALATVGDTGGRAGSAGASRIGGGGGSGIGIVASSRPAGSAGGGHLPVERDGDHVLDLPTSWVPKLSLDRHAALEEALGPAGTTTTLGYRSRLDRYGTHVHPYGLVARCTRYADTQRCRPRVVVEAFERRRDGLVKRVRHCDSQTVEHHFARGAHFSGIALIVDEIGIKQDMYFYYGARVDGLVKRSHVFGRKIREWYYHAGVPAAPGAAAAAASAGGGGAATIATGTGASLLKPTGVSTVAPPNTTGVSRLWYRSIKLAAPEDLRPLPVAPGAVAASSSSSGGGGGSRAAAAVTGIASPHSPNPTTPTPTGLPLPSFEQLLTTGLGGPTVSVDGATVALTIEVAPPRPVEAELEDDLMAAARATAQGYTVSDASGKKRKTIMAPVEHAIMRMTEKYRRDATGKTLAHEDIAKVAYLQDLGAIRVGFHHAPGRITACARLYSKATGKPETLSADPGAPVPRPFDTEVEFARLTGMEKEAHTVARARARMCLEVNATRRMDEAEPGTVATLFESAVERARKGEEIEDDAVDTKDIGTDEVDYLLPFLLAAKCSDPSRPTEKEARRADKECRVAYKERLLERVAIIQKRLEAENDDLLRRQQAFSRNRDHAEGAEEEFEKYCVATTFRIGILEQRLERQEALVRKKFEEMEVRLATDPRLAILHGGGGGGGGGVTRSAVATPAGGAAAGVGGFGPGAPSVKGSRPTLSRM